MNGSSYINIFKEHVLTFFLSLSALYNNLFA